jgi:ferric-dicitrate binding protein FerR (iron transport regulator)
MPTTRLAFLFQRYFDKTATPDEVSEFLRLADREEHAEELQSLMAGAWQGFQATGPVFSADQSDALFQGVMTQARVEAAVAEVEPTPIRRLSWTRAAAAALLVGALGGGAWWFTHPRKPPKATFASMGPKQAAPVVPGANKAILILGDGSAVSLDSVRQGTLARQGNTTVVQLGGGRVAYAAEGGANGGAIAAEYNTIKTPRGGQYQVKLPDGSKVWLNAASSLRFPTAFVGSDRTVELTGEAYFEVADRKNQPFKVKVGDMQVDVLGTHFDVMAYPEEGAVQTSLLQGAVRVDAGAEAQVLKPGQEALLSGGVLRVAEADTDQAVAWKNGLFQFDGATLETIMHQVCRWYDVDVRYERSTSAHFSGQIPRSAPLADVLHMLDVVGKARFSTEGRTVIVK